jgi:hypothetical protein
MRRVFRNLLRIVGEDVRDRCKALIARRGNETGCLSGHLAQAPARIGIKLVRLAAWAPAVADNLMIFKKHQMHWTLRGAYLLLQARTKVFKDELDEVFRRSVPEIQTAITSAGTRAKGWTPTFGALLVATAQM